MTTARPDPTRRRLLRTALAVALAGGAAAAAAYPTRAVQLVVPFAPGGPVDALARAFGGALEAELGRTVNVVNRDGGSFVVAASAVATAAADGHTLYFGPPTPFTVHPHWMKSLPFKREQFTPVCQVFENTFFVAVGPRSPITSFDALVERAKAAPGRLQYGHPGLSSVPHLAAAELAQRLGLELTDVPYRGESPMLVPLANNDLDFAIVTAATAKAQELRPLLTFTEQRLAAHPGVPTARERGVPVVPSGYNGLFARADTPEPALARLESACRAAARSADLRQRADSFSQDVEFLDRRAFGARTEADFQAKGALLKTVKIER